MSRSVPLTVAKLIAELKKLPRDAYVLAYSDAEGNDVHAVMDVELTDGKVYICPADGTWTGGVVR